MRVMRGCIITEGQLRWLRAQVKNLEDRKSIGESGITGTVNWRNGKIVGGRFQVDLPEYVPSFDGATKIEVLLGRNGQGQLVLINFKPVQIPTPAGPAESDCDPLTGIPYGELT